MDAHWVLYIVIAVVVAGCITVRAQSLPARVATRLVGGAVWPLVTIYFVYALAFGGDEPDASP
jgi:hypothetical protein